MPAADREGALTGDAAALRLGNERLLRREQFEVIADDYDLMRSHHPTGPVVTWAMTLLGQPSIPGARGYADVIPETIEFETPGPHSLGTPRSVNGRRIPGVSIDNPLQGRVEIETPFPDGNIANRNQRWAMIKADTLPAFLYLAERDPERLQALIRTPLAERIEEHRLHNRFDELARRIADVNTDLDQ